ncbi:rubrerythrin family protein [Candidatus Falkowbacteria bacterium CG10_big_fil_rev_8_21_14_0_10_43_10]|uniref:Rubrerythrin family protein n=1 Tax=Candidatus Falkowbacteria bacterium CG10_big_fil_rev_8_21_14_0_10_43_10 TaxID=1974567 RepID=A0A2H0V205_9BACT|nr:MAG: rubrerythrin family protein [Candidatus Falkowbacteria bacterium CG10_big_fil_rev_8_21_14_0_10_43_10]
MTADNIKNLLMVFQRNEITEYHVYCRLARLTKGENKEILSRIAADEKRHYEMLKKYTERETGPNRRLVFKYSLLSRIFGLTFAIKLMEKGEEFAQSAYEKARGDVAMMDALMADEQRHEKELIKMIKEEKLDYMGSVVLGLNDALVELTGALAGLSFALQNNRLVALAGLITGIAASFSMAASEYLSKKQESDSNALKASFYTGTAYIGTVLFLVFPYLILSNYLWSLSWTLANAAIIIFIFTYFNSVTKDLKFKKLFWEMIAISFGVAVFSFGVGLILRMWFGIEV